MSPRKKYPPNSTLLDGQTLDEVLPQQDPLPVDSEQIEIALDSENASRTYNPPAE